MDENELVFDVKTFCCLKTWWVKLFGTKVMDKSTDNWDVYLYRGKYFFTDMKIDE